MKADIPFWYKLIYYWCRKKNRSGLTIPFIIGAQNILLPEKKLMEIETLLNEIKDTQLEEKVIIHYCYDLNEFVIGLEEKDFAVSSHFHNYGSFYIGDEKTEKFGDFNKIVSEMKSTYSGFIRDGLYSKDILSSTWQPFQEKDINLIREVY